VKKLIFFLVFVLIVHCTLKIEDCMSQWQPDVRLTNDPFGSWTSYNNARNVASNENYVHVVWSDNRDGNWEIYYKRSTDAGVSWGADVRMTNNTAVSVYPSVAVSGSVVHVVWTDYRDGNFEIYYKRSTDAGISWGADTRLTNNSADSERPSVAVSGQVVHVVWHDFRDGGASEIYYKRSTNAGVNWGGDTRLTNNPAASGYPSITVSGSIVHIVWKDTRDENYEVYYKRSIDGGVNWGADTRLTNNTAESWFPSVAVSGSNVYVVWTDSLDGNYEIYNKRSLNDGISWGGDTRLTNNPAESLFPSVSVSGPVVHVVWYDDRDGNDEIYYKRSTDAGISWGADTRLTTNISNSWNPSAAVSGTVVHVVWMDGRDGNFEIYFKRNPTGNTIGIKNISSVIPSSYSLEQNYPNPFNNTSNLKFQIVNTGDVKLVVYDIMGHEVQTLVNEQLAPGKYETSFDGSQLTSGVYFYKLSTGDFSETRKMLLLK
jgi:hypothetical protein